MTLSYDQSCGRVEEKYVHAVGCVQTFLTTTNPDRNTSHTLRMVAGFIERFTTLLLTEVFHGSGMTFLFHKTGKGKRVI